MLLHRYIEELKGEGIMGRMSELHIEKMTIDELNASTEQENMEEMYQYDLITAAAEVAATNPEMFELFHRRVFELAQ